MQKHILPQATYDKIKDKIIANEELMAVPSPLLSLLSRGEVKALASVIERSEAIHRSTYAAGLSLRS